jgi:MSHA pilin protein MshD
MRAHDPAPAARLACRGTTLIELVVSIVVIAIAAAAVVAALSAVASRSATVMIEQQATSIAASYLNEVLQKPFGVADGQTPRCNFDVVDDYAGLTEVGAHDQCGTAIPGLSQYTVSVAVGGGALPAVPAAEQRLVSVTVTHSSGISVVLSGYRTKH